MSYSGFSTQETESFQGEKRKEAGNSAQPAVQPAVQSPVESAAPPDAPLASRVAPNSPNNSEDEDSQPKAYAACPFFLQQDVAILGDQIGRVSFLSEFEVMSIFKNLESVEREGGLAEVDKVVSYVLYEKLRYAILPIKDYPLHIAVPCVAPDEMEYPIQCFVIDDTMSRLAK